MATLAIFQVFILRLFHFNQPPLFITLQALDVDPILNMLVFGESILNDAVSIVLTTTIVESGDSEVQDSSMAYQVGAGIGRSILLDSWRILCWTSHSIYSVPIKVLHDVLWLCWYWDTGGDVEFPCPEIH